MKRIPNQFAAIIISGKRIKVNQVKRKLLNEFEVRATLDGRKSQFREVIKPQPKEVKAYTMPWFHPTNWYDADTLKDIRLPYQVGDRLWVAETWGVIYHPTTSQLVYRADYQPMADVVIKWKSSVQMQKQASRITLEVTGVRVERLNEISEQDAIAEGIIELANREYSLDGGKFRANYAVGSFRQLWKSTNGKKHPWQSNPWVWVIDYKAVEDDQQ